MKKIFAGGNQKRLCHRGSIRKQRNAFCDVTRLDVLSSVYLRNTDISLQLLVITLETKVAEQIQKWSYK